MESTDNLIGLRGYDHNPGIVTTAFRVIFAVSTIANFIVIIRLIKRRLQLGSNRFELLLTHLVIANFLVTFMMIPAHIFWVWRMEWKSTELACRAMMFLKDSGVYLTGFMLICLIIDRSQIMQNKWSRTKYGGSMMAAWAWILTVLCCSCEAYIYYFRPKMSYESIQRCVPFSIMSSSFEMIYKTAQECAWYVVPAIIMIIFSVQFYLNILKKRQHMTHLSESIEAGNLDAYQRRSLKMTLTMSLLFLICKTPLHVMHISSTTFVKTPVEMNYVMVNGLLLLSCSYCALNSIIYILFNIRWRSDNALRLKPTSGQEE